MAGGLALLAATVFLSGTFAITRLPLATDADGVAAYAIPGSRHVIDAAIVPVLASIGLAAAALGLLALAVGRLPRSMIGMTTVAPSGRWWRPTIRRQPLILLLGVAALAAVLWLKR